MRMEQRWGRRYPLHAAVLIDHPSYGDVRGSIGDISGSGVFVRALTAPLTEGAVDLTIVCQDPEASELLHVRAIVVRHTPQGIGLMFDEFQPQALVPLLSRLAARYLRLPRTPGPTRELGPFSSEVDEQRIPGTPRTAWRRADSRHGWGEG